MKFDRFLTLILTALILFGFLNTIPISVQSKEINIFDNGDGGDISEVVLTGRPGFATDATTYFTIPIHKGKIQEASVKITASPDKNGSSLLNPRLDVGIDGDYEWEFKGKGYGAAGHQTLFTNGNSRRIMAIGNSKINTGTNIYLPKGAFVSDASMEIKGGNLQYGEIYITAVNRAGEVYFIKSNGDRTFGSAQQIDSVGSYSYGVGMGDFDNDGDNDIVVNQGYWTSTTGNIYMFKKTGLGNSFSKIPTPVGYTASSSNTDFAVGDFDNDDNLDFIESGMNQNFYFFKGKGDNTFVRTQITNSFSGGSAYGKDAADFDLDGNLDFVAGGSSSGNVFVFEGNGDGTFKKPPISVNVGTTSGAQCVFTGDFDNDGNHDIIAHQRYSNDDLRFVEGLGDGTFKAYDKIDNEITVYASYPTGDAFDFDFDGNQDFVTFDNSGTIKCYWGNNDNNGKTFTNPTEIGTISSLTGIATPPGALLGGCNNLKIDIGNDGGDPDFQFTGAITDTETITGTYFKDELNDILANPPANLKQITDDYGNILLEIPLRFSSDAIGNLLLQSLDIKYTYTATVDKNPHNGDLVNELNDLIPQGNKGDFRVYFSIASNQPGKVKFSELSIVFNEAPTLTTPIPDLVMNEGTDQSHLKNLADNFYDDRELPADLKYSIHSYTNRDYLKVSIEDDVWLHVNAKKDPDWSGQSEIVVSVEDSENGITRSNEFTVTINPVNDIPRTGVKIGNIELIRNSIYDKLDLDSKSNYFFYDVDSSDLYFRAIIYDEENSGRFDGYLQLSIDNDTNVLSIHSFDRPKNRIPVRIYCSDTEEIRTMELNELIKMPVHQTFLVNITKLGMGKKVTYPPIWHDIEDIQIAEDDSIINWLNLNNYISDRDNTPEELTFTVESMTNSAFINVYVTANKNKTENLISLEPEPDFDGEAVIILRAEDYDHNYAFEQFTIEIIPRPDIPIVQILSPANNSMASGIVTVSGSAYDAEDGLVNVEIQIGNNPWLPVDGLEYWSYDWKSYEDSTATDIVWIKVRAIDADNSYSIYDRIYLQINNLVLDDDHDGVLDIYDACPQDPLNWVDSDGDNVGDNSDKFPNDITQWADSDGDGYGDNPYGNSPDSFPFDPTQWKDTDGDGFGDNPDGNNPDTHPNDPTKYTIAPKKGEEPFLTTEQMPWVVLTALVIIDLVIIVYFVSKRRRSIK